MLGNVLRLFSAAVLGVSAGVMLVGAVVLVPYWRSLGPADFLSWFAANARRMLLVAGPLQSIGMLLAIGAAIASRHDVNARFLAYSAALLAMAVLALYFTYFGKANASFVAATISGDEVAHELARWAVWQWVRTALGLAAFATSLLALTRVSRTG
jgi:hypothetical protein